MIPQHRQVPVHPVDSLSEMVSDLWLPYPELEMVINLEAENHQASLPTHIGAPIFWLVFSSKG
jgi:hypothetical protein